MVVDLHRPNNLLPLPGMHKEGNLLLRDREILK
jgi:hypothetical protein